MKSKKSVVARPVCALFAFCLALTPPIPFGLPAQEAAAHDTGCTSSGIPRRRAITPEGATSETFTGDNDCQHHLSLEFIDWCLRKLVAENRLDGDVIYDGDADDLFCATRDPDLGASWCSPFMDYGVHDFIGGTRQRLCVRGPAGRANTCAAGQNYNIDVHACRCPDGRGFNSNGDGTCVECGANEELNAANGNCEPPCADGMFRSKAGPCVSQCPAEQFGVDKQCLTAAEKCDAADGWSYNSQFVVECNFDDANGIRNASANQTHTTCELPGGSGKITSRVHFICADAFGPNLDFPPPLPEGKSHYVYNCDGNPENPTGLIPASFNLNAETECECEEADAALIGSNPGRCYAQDAGVEDFSDSDLCVYFRGNPSTAGGRICSGVDAADTFCLLDSCTGRAAGSPDCLRQAADPNRKQPLACRGLLRHVWNCNEMFDRPALNPFLCGGKCPDGQEALGAACR